MYPFALANNQAKIAFCLLCFDWGQNFMDRYITNRRRSDCSRPALFVFTVVAKK